MSTMIGIVFGAGLLVYAVFMRSGWAFFYDPPSLMIVFGGTLASVLVSSSLSQMFAAIRILKNPFGARTSNASAYISVLLRLAQKARKESIQGLRDDAGKVKNPFLQTGLQLLVDGRPPELVRSVLETELERLISRHEEGAHIFRMMGRFAPAFGLLGTLIGLISIVRGVSGEMEAIGSGMALAMLTTFYGLLSAYLLFLPIAERLENRPERDAFQARMIIEGVLMIQEGENLDRMEKKLSEYLDPEQRMKHLEQMLQRER